MKPVAVAASAGLSPVSYTHLDVYKRQTRYMKRGGRVYITIFPDKPITKKPAETRMGSGKGNPEEWVAVVKPEMCIRDRVHPSANSGPPTK